jgi:N-methylhydantoinase B
MNTIDPIRLEIIRNALVAAAEEMSVAVRRTSRSTVVREIGDYSTAVFDASGRNVAQSARLPNHLNTMGPCITDIITSHLPLESWCEGDTIVTNDPYCGGQHLPDIVVFRPVFVDHVRVALVGAMAHHIDVGGSSAGSYDAKATTIFQEGIRIPPMKIIKSGVLNEEVIAIILQNVREPEMLRGDLASQMAALEIGERNIVRLARKYGSAFLTTAADQIIAQSERLMRAAIAKVPAGVYEFEDFLDDDGINPEPIRICVKLTFQDDEVIIDLSGSAPQVDGPLNCTLNMTRSAIYFALIAAIGDDIPANSGCYAPIKIVAPPGTIVNCLAPAPVVARIAVCHRVVNVIMGALAQALPERIPASYYGVSYVYIVEALSDDGTRQVYLDAPVGGYGADAQEDGANGLSAGIHNAPNTPMEMVESMYPIAFTGYGLRCDSAGAGRTRGGLGMYREFRLESRAGILGATFDRFRFAPFGLFGGRPGATGRLILRRNGQVEELGSKIAKVRLTKGDVVRIETSGGGGYGDPSQRPRTLIDADIAVGYITRECAERDYGYPTG